MFQIIWLKKYPRYFCVLFEFVHGWYIVTPGLECLFDIECAPSIWNPWLESVVSTPHTHSCPYLVLCVSVNSLEHGWAHQLATVGFHLCMFFSRCFAYFVYGGFAF